MGTWVGVDILVDHEDEHEARKSVRQSLQRMGYEICPDEVRLIAAEPDAITQPPSQSPLW